jgi:hypothetical protein
VSRYLLIFILLYSTNLLGQEIDHSEIEYSKLINWLRHLDYSPSSVATLNKSLQITKEYLASSKEEISPQAKRTLALHRQKLTGYTRIAKQISSCLHGDDVRALQDSVLLAAAGEDPCHSKRVNPLELASVKRSAVYIGEIALAQATHHQGVMDLLTSKLTTSNIFPFSTKQSGEKICDQVRNRFLNYQEEITQKCQMLLSSFQNDPKSYPSYPTIESAQNAFNQKAFAVNKLLIKLNRGLEKRLTTFARENPGSTAWEWKELLLKLAKDDPLYHQYLKQYNQSTSDTTGRLLLIPPLDAKFRSPLNFKWQEIGTPIMGADRSIHITLPLHGAQNPSYAPTANNPLIVTKELIEELTERLHQRQDIALNKLALLTHRLGNPKSSADLTKVAPYSLGAVLINHPDLTPYACKAMNEIMSDDRRTKLIFDVIDYIALGIGVVPVFGWGTSLTVKGSSAASRALLTAGRFATSQSVTAINYGMMSVEAGNILHRLDHYQEILNTLMSTVANSPKTSSNLKQQLQQAKDDLDSAILYSYMAGGAALLSSTAGAINLLRISRLSNPVTMSKQIKNLSQNIRAQSRGMIFPDELVYHNSQLTHAARLGVTKALIPRLTRKQKDAILVAHNIGIGTSDIYRYSRGEIIQKYRTLRRAGIKEKDAVILIKSGLVGKSSKGWMGFLLGRGNGATDIGKKATVDKAVEAASTKKPSVAKKLFDKWTKSFRFHGDKIPYATLNGKNLDPSYYQTLYHGHHALPHKIPDISEAEAIELAFKEGLPARGKNSDLLNYAEELYLRENYHHSKKLRPSFRGTTREIASPGDLSSAAINWADEGGYIYEIKGVPGWDVNMHLDGRVKGAGGYYRGNSMSGENEIAIHGKVPGKYICRIGRVTRSYAGRLVIKTMDWTINPHYAGSEPCP